MSDIATEMPKMTEEVPKTPEEKTPETTEEMPKTPEMTEEKPQEKRPVSVKRYFLHLSMEYDNRKIGSIIKRFVTHIRKEVGAGVFANWKGEDDVTEEAFSEWLKAHPFVPADTPNMGQGWYIWSFNEGSTMLAKSLIQESEDYWFRRQARQQRFAERSKSSVIMVTFPNTTM